MQDNPLILFHYWRSSASWRVRWALELKKLKPKMIAIDLLNDDTESSEHKARNPFSYVPVLQVGHRYLVESVAILEWLDENYGETQLIIGDSFQKAHIRSLVEFINAGTQPMINMPVFEYHSADETKRKEWCQYFLRRGLSAFQERVQLTSGRYCMGGQLTAADLCLVPQLYSANRWGINLEKEFPLLKGIYDNCLETKEAYASRPEAYEQK